MSAALETADALSVNPNWARLPLPVGYGHMRECPTTRAWSNPRAQ